MQQFCATVSFTTRGTDVWILARQSNDRILWKSITRKNISRPRRRGHDRNALCGEMSFIKISILCRYFLTGCYTPKKPPKTVVEKIACHLEPTPKWILMPALCAGEQSAWSHVVCVIKWICPCAAFSNFLQTSSSAGGESGDPGGCHACGVPGARPERPQPAVCVQHQNPSRESQWVNCDIAVNMLRSFLKDADFFSNVVLTFLSSSPQYARHSGGDVSRDASSRQTLEGRQRCLRVRCSLQRHATGLKGRLYAAELNQGAGSTLYTGD